MNDVLYELFDKLDGELGKVEQKHGPDEAEIHDFEVVARRDKAEKTKGNDQAGDESGKIASLNDRFRQDPDTKDSDIKGEWIMGDDISALPVPTKAAIKRRVAEHDSFENTPLRDHGEFNYETKGRKLPVIWMIKTYSDASKTVEASQPENPQTSYRVMLVTLSEERS